METHGDTVEGRNPKQPPGNQQHLCEFYGVSALLYSSYSSFFNAPNRWEILADRTRGWNKKVKMIRRKRRCVWPQRGSTEIRFWKPKWKYSIGHRPHVFQGEQINSQIEMTSFNPLQSYEQIFIYIDYNIWRYMTTLYEWNSLWTEKASWTWKGPPQKPSDWTIGSRIWAF